MPKNENRASEPPAKPADSISGLDALEAKLGPLDEFRGRAESWMKEITAQVARLAGRSEDEERRKNALDKRLNDIEDRMQSLLTLTEMVSLSKNPFAGPPREQPATPKSDRPTPTKSADASPGDAIEPQDAPRPRPVDEPARPPAPTQAPVPEKASARIHPNDATADLGRPHVPQPSVADTFPQRAVAANSAAPAPPHQRLFVLEWARVLAPAAHRIDLSGFLGFYAEAGWAGRDLVAAVRNLTLQLARDAKETDDGTPLDGLHARSIQLLGRLQGQPARSEAPPAETAASRGPAVAMTARPR